MSHWEAIQLWFGPALIAISIERQGTVSGHEEEAVAAAYKMAKMMADLYFGEGGR